MLTRKSRTFKAADLYWHTFAFREKPVTVDIRPTQDLRRKDQQPPHGAQVQLKLV